MLEKLIETAPGTLLSLTAILCGTLFLLTWITWHYWHYSRLSVREIEFKRDMLARGLSAGDVERVLWVSGENAPYSEPKHAPETVSANEYALIEKMLDNEAGMDDIERLVRAMKSGQAPRPLPPARPEDMHLELT